MLNSEQVLELFLKNGITRSKDKQVLLRWTREGKIKGHLKSRKEGFRYETEEIKKFIQEMNPSINSFIEGQNMKEELEKLRNENNQLKETIRFLLEPKPIIRWVGGKQQLVNNLLRKSPKKYNRYIEPFFGGGAFFFALNPREAIISDINEELINMYKVVANSLDELISVLLDLSVDEKTFYELRALDQRMLTKVDRAARTLYLNRTCFGGLFRVNAKGEFNASFHKGRNHTLIEEKKLRVASFLLQRAEILCADYKDVLRKYVSEGDFVFLDPPYLPVAGDDFIEYTKEKFTEQCHIELADEVKKLKELGCCVIVTNSNHPKIHELFSDYKITVYKTRRSINVDLENQVGEDLLVVVEP